MLQRILVPLDGSEFAECVIPYVEELCQRCNPVEIILLQVIRPPSGRSFSEPVARPLVYDYPILRLPDPPPEISSALRGTYEEQEVASARSQVEGTLLPVAKRFCDGGAFTRVAVAFGRPAEQIVGFAEQQKMDLIALSTHGRSGLSRWVFGSVAEKVLRGTNLPILLVRPSEACVHEAQPQSELER
jgi:nucleotide-binding universal stress UspA family protein